MALKDDPIIATYVLKTPVKLPGDTDTLYKLEFRALVTADHLKVEKMVGAGTIERTKEYLQLSTLAMHAQIDRMSMPDFLEAGKIVNNFLAQDFQKLTAMT